MSVMNFNQFGGKAPKIDATKLAGGMGQIATNTKLYGKSLNSFRAPLEFAALTKTGLVQTLHRYAGNSAWLHWTQDVNVAQVPVANDTLEKVVFTGTDKPRITTNTLYDEESPGTNLPPASYILGIPAPADTPVAVADGAGNVTGSVNWVYTFVRTWSDNSTDEGPPSAASNTIVAEANKIDVSMPNAGAPTFADYGITHKRLYRIVTTETGAEYQFVTEVTAATETYEDNVQIPGEVLQTELYLPPPDAMIGAIALPNGVIVGFKDNTLYFSEPARPHAYPVANQYTVAFQIVALGHYGTTVVVATEGLAYLYQGTDPAAMSGRDLPQKQACVSKPSLVSAEFGVMYASRDGLVLIGPGGMTLVTREFFDREKWAAYYPHTIHAASFDGGRYIGFYITGNPGDGTRTGAGFIFDRREGADAFVDLNFYAYSLFDSIGEGALFMGLKEEADKTLNQVYQWDAHPAKRLVYTWHSRKEVSAAQENFGFAMVDAEFPPGIAAGRGSDEQIAAIRAYNQALLATETNGTWNGGTFTAEGGQVNVPMWNGDTILLHLPVEFDSDYWLNFRYWGDAVLKYERLVSDREPFPLPAGFLPVHHEVELTGKLEVHQIALGSDPEELGKI